jgi:hypothetical protein
MKKELLDKLYEQDHGHRHKCHYCKMEEGEFLKLWGGFYGLPYRGRRLEIDRRKTVVKKGNDIIKIDRKYALKNCVLACALCNMAKSNMFTYDEFKRVGEVIKEIWQERKRSGLKVK